MLVKSIGERTAYESAHCRPSAADPNRSSRGVMLGPKIISSFMAPVATHPPSDDVSRSSVSASEKGPALVIGSLSTAQDGKYQRVVSELEASRQVERQMLDRLLDRGNVSVFFDSVLLMSA
jgi:hypothetical protein